MKLTLLAVGLLAGTASFAIAADLGGRSLKDEPVHVLPATWTGLYVGGHAGLAWGNVDIRDRDGLNGDPDLHTGGAAYSMHDTTYIGGGQIGYNFQREHIVLGVEADIGGIGFSKSKFDPNFPDGTKSGIRSGFYGDLTGRIGYAFDQRLIYAKAGVALYNGEATVDNTAGEFEGGIAATDTFVGWTVGGGIEHMLSPGLSIKAEYQYFDFGSKNAVLHTPEFGDYAYGNDLTAHTVTVGFNCKLDRREERLK